MAKKSASKKQVNNTVLIAGAITVPIVLLLTVMNLNNHFSPPVKHILGESENKTEQKTYWEEFLAKHPNYHEGWEQLANIEESLGNASAAGEAIKKAKEIKPNSP